MNPDRSLDLNASRLLTALSGEPLSLGDVDAVRLLLKGNSVIDWNRAHFGTRDDVDRFLRLHLLDPDDPEDQRRLRFVHGEAVHYLQEHLDLSFPRDLVEPEDVRDIFVRASETGGFRRRQILSCVILKLMHVINHLEAAELRHQTPLSESAILDLAEQQILGGRLDAPRASPSSPSTAAARPATASSRSSSPRRRTPPPRCSTSCASGW